MDQTVGAVSTTSAAHRVVMTKADFEALARFRSGIRRYLRFSEETVRGLGDVLWGRVRLRFPGDDVCDGLADSLLTVSGRRHELEAPEDAVTLLTEGGRPSLARDGTTP